MEPNDHGTFVSCATGYPMDYATAKKGLNLSSRMEMGLLDTGPLRVGGYGKVAWTGKVSRTMAATAGIPPRLARLSTAA